MTPITIIKRDHTGVPQFEYMGEVVERGDNVVCLRAVFGRDDHDEGYVTFARGDVMIEWFFSDRWYNIFEIYAGQSAQIKGWYCNITRPAVIVTTDAGMVVAADDLALDVFITPRGDGLLLDADEFDALPLSDDERAAAWAAVESIERMAARREPPFDKIPRPKKRRER
jgi:uncharacterized protein